jgi:hypothetical protein
LASESKGRTEVKGIVASFVDFPKFPSAKGRVFEIADSRSSIYDDGEKYIAASTTIYNYQKILGD